MSDDAELSAAYDAAQGGTAVIDTTQGQIEPDEREPRPHVAEQEEFRFAHDALHEQVSHAYDLAMAKQQRSEQRNPPMLPMMSGVEAAAEWLAMSHGHQR